MNTFPDPSPLKDSNNTQVALMQSAVRFNAEIASLAVTAASLDDLLNQIVNLVTQRFGYYHASVFLVDEAAVPEHAPVAVLRAAAGKAAEEIVKAGERIIVGSRSIVGWVAANNQHRLASDVSQEFFYQRHALLSETRSEVAIPIAVRIDSASGVLSGGAPGQENPEQRMKVLGVLDVQHTLENAFTPDTITILQTTAHHLAAVIQNYQLLETTRRNLSLVSVLYQASSLMARASTIQDIHAAIQHVLDESIYPHQQLVILQGATGSEDELVPYTLSESEPGSLGDGAQPQAGEPGKAAGAAPKLYLAAAEKCLQQAGSTADSDTQHRQESATSDLADQSQTAPFLPYIRIDLRSAAGQNAQSEACPELAAYARAVYSLSQGLLSAVFIPVTRLNRLQALLLIGAGDEAVILPDQLQAYTSLADLATTAIERLYAIQMMQKRLTVMQTLNVIGQAVSVQTNLQELFQVIYTEVKNLMGEISFLIALYEPENEAFNIPATISVPFLVEMGAKEAIELAPFPLGEGLTSIVINTRQPLVLVEDTERRSVELGARLVGVSAKSWMGVPLLVAGDAIGAIVVQDPYQERRFDDDDLRLMVTLAPQVAVAIRNARLLESTHRQAERERAVNEITAQIRASGSAQKILQTATEEVGRLLGASRVRMVLRTGEVNQPPLTGGRPYGEGTAGQDTAQGEPL